MLCLLFSGTVSFSQSKDSTISFKVFGACEQCKERIEDVLKIKGVKSAVWDVDSQELSLVYNPSKISLEKIQNKIVAAGHDLDNKKANVTVYNALPKCCHYRELEIAADHIKHDADENKVAGIKAIVDSSLKNALELNTSADEANVRGVVLAEDNKGNFTPLQNASIFWSGTNEGVLTDKNGLFNIKFNAVKSNLVVSFAGYSSDTISVSALNELKIVLASNKQLKEVVVSSTKRSVYVNNSSAIRTLTMGGSELLKAACCNLSESFETNPSVDVSYNDAVTGSKQIQLLGLSGNYTQLTVENLPGPRGLATALGLNSIAGPWIESIQLTKGTGSVANGYESIAGQINVELKKPENSEKLLANLYVNDQGKTELNLNLAQKINAKWSAGLLLHDDLLAKMVFGIYLQGITLVWLTGISLITAKVLWHNLA